MRAASHPESRGGVLARPPTSTATTNSPSRIAVRMRSASRASGTSTSSNLRPRPKRRAYSVTPASIQAGSRLPAAISRMRMSGLRLSHAGFALRGAQVPELLEPVELADARQHDVHDKVLQVDEHPLALALALDAVGTVAGLAATLDQPVRDRLDVPVGIAGRHDHRVGDVGELANVEHLDVHGLHVCKRGDGDLGQGTRFVPGLLRGGSFAFRLRSRGDHSFVSPGRA